MVNRFSHCVNDAIIKKRELVQRSQKRFVYCCEKILLLHSEVIICKQSGEFFRIAACIALDGE